MTRNEILILRRKVKEAAARNWRQNTWKEREDEEKEDAEKEDEENKHDEKGI